MTVAELLNKTDIIEGDSKYLAPELLDRQCDEKADIFRFSFALLFFQSTFKPLTCNF